MTLPFIQWLRQQEDCNREQCAPLKRPSRASGTNVECGPSKLTSQTNTYILVLDSTTIYVLITCAISGVLIWEEIESSSNISACVIGPLDHSQPLSWESLWIWNSNGRSYSDVLAKLLTIPQLLLCNSGSRPGLLGGITRRLESSKVHLKCIWICEFELETKLLELKVTYSG